MARLALLLAAALAAGCPSGGGGDDYPVGGGGGGGGGGGPRTDAGDGDGGVDGQTLIGGRVCVLTDLRRLINAAPGDCASSGAGNLSVSLGGGSPVLTAGDGSFAIPAQPGTNLAWQVQRLNAIVRSIVPVSTSTLLPAIRDIPYGEILSRNSVILLQGQGSIVARILRGGAPVANATARVTGGESQQTLYDGDDPLVWSTIATGAFGVAWLPDNAAGARELQVTLGTSTLRVPVTIVDQAITFVTIALP